MAKCKYTTSTTWRTTAETNYATSNFSNILYIFVSKLNLDVFDKRQNFVDE